MSFFPDNVKNRKRLILGLMSGTSCDALDMALIQIKNQGQDTQYKFLAGQSSSYSIFQKQFFLEKIGESMNPCQLSQFNFYLAEIWADKINAFINALPNSHRKIDLIASHGQTIWHQPEPQEFIDRRVSSTLQIGDPSVLAQLTGIPVVGDFRVADVALGGQGAPLIPYFDWVHFSKYKKNFLVLNLGGISNLTFVAADGDFSRLTAFDCGPGNMLIDRAMQVLFQSDYDENGQIAQAGNLSDQLLAFIGHIDPFVKSAPPKSTGRELYGENFLKRILRQGKKLSLGNEDIITTISTYTAYCVFENYSKFIFPEVCEILVVGGGGLKNQFIIDQLKKYFSGIPVLQVDNYNLNSDFKEAIGFAVLGNETMMKRPSNVPQVTGASRPAVLGKICLP